MAYNPKKWKNNKVGKTPIEADDLNRIEEGIAALANSVSLWTGSSLGSIITLNDNPNNYQFLMIKTDSNYTVLVPSTLNGSSFAGRSVIENSNYVRYEVYFCIIAFNNDAKTIQFAPTYLFKNGAYNKVVNITEIVGIN